MRIIEADETRRIDLPGVGPCPRPVDIDQGVTGFSRLKSLRIYRFAPGPAIEGESEEDEVFVLPLSGAVDIAVTGRHEVRAALGPEGPLRALYMTPHHAYRLTPHAATLVAYARAEARGAVPAQALGTETSSGLAEALGYRLVALASGEVFNVAEEGERLVHVAEGRVAAGPEVHEAGQTLALSPGEGLCLTAEGPARLLVVAA